MQGGSLGGGDDPYWDAGRLGGTLTHLAREHPPTGECVLSVANTGCAVQAAWPSCLCARLRDPGRAAAADRTPRALLLALQRRTGARWRACPWGPSSSTMCPCAWRHTRCRAHVSFAWRSAELLTRCWRRATGQLLPAAAAHLTLPPLPLPRCCSLHRRVAAGPPADAVPSLRSATDARRAEPPGVHAGSDVGAARAGRHVSPRRAAPGAA